MTWIDILETIIKTAITTISICGLVYFVLIVSGTFKNKKTDKN